MSEPRVVFFHPPTGVVTSQPFEGFELEPLSGAGRLWRTRREGRWVAEWEAGAGERSGWEEVLFEEVERPLAWYRGPRSGHRFGFGGPTTWERQLWMPEDGPPVTVLVLPDVPGAQAPANCPGARYGFQVGMICDGIPADYLAEKLLQPAPAREPLDEEEDDDLEALVGELAEKGVDALDEFELAELEDIDYDPTDEEVAEWDARFQEQSRIRALALDLSDDLAEAARELFGENVDYTSYSRKRAAEHQRRRFINPN